MTYSFSSHVKSFWWALYHVRTLKRLHWGWWLTDSMLPVKCWQRWAQNMLPFLPIASGDAMATRQKKLGPPRHSTHALASIVKRLKSSPSVFFRAEITESFNVEPPCLDLLHFSLLSPCSPLLRHPLCGYGGKCEALITPQLLCFKRSCSKLQFPLCYQFESKVLALSDFHLQPAESQKHQRTITTFLKVELSWTLLENSSIRSAHGGDSPALTVQKGDCLGLELSGILCGRLWKRARWLSLGNPDITQTACYAHDWFEWLKQPINKAIRLGGILKLARFTWKVAESCVKMYIRRNLV